MMAAEPHSGMGLVGEVPQAAVAVLLDEAGQEPIAGYVYQKCSQSFWDLRWVVKLYPQWIGNGWMKKILCAPAEVWLILSVSQQAPVCLLGFVQTCGPKAGIMN
ncbi:hypothetical protein PanWU01x14_306160 [Parasponia andersonii]|uniref:Uncharacterized protein n=1 Tax=Parasponia andersonii TaxID=3476 RepID=A0A2P5AS34_PARAD|nr:hypothetical protein PanWU01x14_306160 [Parasponia andersonii]